MPNFTALDVSLPDVATLVAAIVQARDAVSRRRSWSHTQEPIRMHGGTSRLQLGLFIVADFYSWQPEPNHASSRVAVLWAS